MKLLVLFLLYLYVSVGSASLANRYAEVCEGKQIQIFSDVDDTLKASGTNFVAGCDTRWLGGSIYGGAPQFYLELSRGHNEEHSWYDTPLPIGISSARPKSLGNKFPDIEALLVGAAKNTSLHEKWGKIERILAGEIADNLHVHVEKKFKDYAETKYRNVKNFAKENENVCIIFIGDNGQGDQLAGVKMLENIPSVAAVFIHNVTSKPVLKVDQPENLFLFETYPEAAVIAWQQGFITKAAAERVVKATLISGQFQQCVECLENHDSCDLKAVTPHYYLEDGGCEDLWDAIVASAERLEMEPVTLPDLTLAIVDPDGPGFFSRLLWRVIALAIFGGIAFFLYTQYKNRKAKPE